MSKDSPDRRKLTAAERGCIVQRVLVDGLSPAQAGAAFGVDGPLVDRWVAEYRRFGMASLRDECAADNGRALGGWGERLVAWLRKRRASEPAPDAPPRAVPAVRSDDDRGPAGPTPRSSGTEGAVPR